MSAATRLPPELSPATAKRVPIRAERSRFGTRPPPSGFDIVERRRISMLGRETVIDRHDDRLEAIGENPAKLVMRVERPDDPSSAMRVENERQCVDAGGR